MVILLSVGLLQVTEEGPAFTIIAFLGGFFLLWMGWRIVRNRGLGLPHTPHTSDRTNRSGHYPPGRPIVEGAVVSITNPFWSLWWITVGASFLAETRSLGLGVPGISAFYLGHVLSDYFWFSLVSAAVGSGRRIMSGNFYRGIVIVCGFFLWGAGCFFIVTGLERVV